MPPPDPLPAQRPGAVPFGIWLGSGRPAGPNGVVWLVRPMPDGQWPPDRDAPRDDSWNWWVRSHCGHPGGARQSAFSDRRYVDMYEQVFREEPCRWTRCERYQTKIENERGKP